LCFRDRVVVLNDFFYQRDRVVVLNDFFYQTRRSTHSTEHASACILFSTRTRDTVQPCTRSHVREVRRGGEAPILEQEMNDDPGLY
jgi:hypothetical protein